MSKYTVKNCPMYFHGNCYGHTANYDCKNCTDCLIRQIIEKCIKKLAILTIGSDVGQFANNVLQLFDIEEVE